MSFLKLDWNFLCMHILYFLEWFDLKNSAFENASSQLVEITVEGGAGPVVQSHRQ